MYTPLKIFDKVQEMTLPEEVRATIERYMSAIEFYHDTTRTRFRPWIQTWRPSSL